jgi:hypothetical protein
VLWRKWRATADEGGHYCFAVARYDGVTCEAIELESLRRPSTLHCAFWGAVCVISEGRLPWSGPFISAADARRPNCASALWGARKPGIIKACSRVVWRILGSSHRLSQGGASYVRGEIDRQ